MRKVLVVVTALVVVASACAAGTSERTVLVDYTHDEFASFFLFNFPKRIEVTPGTEVVFKQTWTGEPHTVTAGTVVDDALDNPLIRLVTSFENLAGAGVKLPNPDGPPGDETLADVLELVEDSKPSVDRERFNEAYDALVEADDAPERNKADDVPFSEFVEDVTPGIDKAFEALPFAFGESPEQLNQGVSRPCYLEEGTPPKDPTKSCADAQQKQPDFDGTQSYYNSGIIPYEGQQGNTFRVPLADDIEPGNYWFYCAVHGFGQSTLIEVKPSGSDVPSQGAVSRAAREEIEPIADDLEKLWKDASDGRFEVETEDGEETVRAPFAGLHDPTNDHASINEFVPKTIEAEAGDPITWTMLGAQHTISFGVPDYFPIVEFPEGGAVRMNPKLSPPAGGAKELEVEERPDGPPIADVLEFDGGTYDGDGFWSSGLVGAEPYLKYTMRISEPGTYRYACLIHPPMVGTVRVT